MMGILKCVLGMLGTVQIVLAFLYADKGFQRQQLNILRGYGERATHTTAVLMELLCPLYLGMAMMNLFSWRMGSDMRPRVACANIAVLGGSAIVHYRHASTNTALWASIAGMLIVAVGLVTHQMEPGLLTADKKASKTKKGY